VTLAGRWSAFDVRVTQPEAATVTADDDNLADLLDASVAPPTLSSGASAGQTSSRWRSVTSPRGSRCPRVAIAEQAEAAETQTTAARRPDPAARRMRKVGCGL
jgi:hypothetical protein